MRMVKPEDIDFDIFVDEENMIIQATVAVYDAVPVVRCKDCKHRDHYECNNIMLGKTRCGVTDDWFCADGERKDNET